MIYERRNLSFIQGCKDFFKGIINPFGRTTRKGFLCGLLMDFSVVIFICAVIISFVSTKVGSLIFFASYYCLLTRRYLDLGFNFLNSPSKFRIITDPIGSKFLISMFNSRPFL